MMPLKNVLLVNGASSGATGVLLVAFARFIADLFQVTSAMPFVSVGVFLVLFAVLVISVAMNANSQTKKVQVIIVLDVVWTVASFLFVIFFHDEIPMIGNALIIGVALWVAAMAYLQTRGLKQITL